MIKKEHKKYAIGAIIAGTLGFIGVFALSMWGLPTYSVWQQEMSGKAQFSKAEWSKKVKVEEARALKDAAKFLAQAEVERAKGVAKANKIIGDSLKGNHAYLKYLWIQGLHNGNSETIYIPTEANLPILEATRRFKTKK